MFKIIFMCGGVLAACSMGSLPWKKHPVPHISLEKAKEIKTSFCREKNIKCDDYYEEPVILDSSYVFYWKLPSVEKVAAEKGVWIDIVTGEAFFLGGKRNKP